MMMKKNKKSKSKKADQLIEDASFMLHRSKGNGVLRRQIWANENDEVTRYNLAYINHRLFGGDNGRVLGYDNAHGYHHRHYFGEVEAINFESFEQLETLFQQEFEVLHEKAKSTK